MQLGIIGLGRMGGNMRERLREAGHDVVGFDLDPKIADVAALMSKGDLIIDGGNSKFTDDARRAERLAKLGIGYLDCGVSGGVWGLHNGYGLMVGGAAED